MYTVFSDTLSNKIYLMSLLLLFERKEILQQFKF